MFYVNLVGLGEKLERIAEDLMKLAIILGESLPKRSVDEEFLALFA